MSVKCNICGGAMRLRTTAPYTAIRNGMDYFDYWHCAHCRVNSATPKQREGAIMSNEYSQYAT